PDFEEFVSFVTSGLSCVLLISQEEEVEEEEEGEEEEVIEEETQPQSDAEEEEPSENPEETHVKFAPVVTKKKRDSLQEYLERQHIAELCDVEDDASKISKLIDILFPNFKTMKSKNIQKTLALLLPEVYEESKVEILKAIKEEGFEKFEKVMKKFSSTSVTMASGEMHTPRS
ncbi:hypothetical protein A6R68_07482, partial [Neotoma lepida]